jgi:putative exporter of polyketide antibiotics
MIGAALPGGWYTALVLFIVAAILLTTSLVLSARAKRKSGGLASEKRPGRGDPGGT